MHHACLTVLHLASVWLSIKRITLSLLSHRSGHSIVTRGVSHCGLAIEVIKYLKAKEELWKLKKKNLYFEGVKIDAT